MLRNGGYDSRARTSLTVLNEVLSLNAQESTGLRKRGRCKSILNEVLSLNAQEWDARAIRLRITFSSSMKS